MDAKTLLISLAVGIGAGLIDVLLSYQYEENKWTLGAIAFHWAAVGFLMPHIDVGMAVGLTGAFVGFILAVPFMIMEWPKDPKAIIPMLIFSPVMGLIIAVVGDYLIERL